MVILIGRHWRLPLITLLAFILILKSVGSAGSERPRPSDALMQEALDVIGLIIGRELGDDDRAWMRERWMSEADDRPEGVIAGLEAFAVAREGIESGSDPMALAQLRTETIDESYCATGRSGDANTARQRAMFAPDDLVLAMDCVTGAVVTPFDVEALVRSNALVGQLLDEPVDMAATEASILTVLENGIGGLGLESQQRILWGELRAAALRAYWDSADEAERAQLVAAARQTFEANGDVPSTALALEKMALRRIGEVQAIASAGGVKFRLWEMGAILEHLAFVTGASPTPAERAELAAMFVRNFHEDPERTIGNARYLRLWLDKDYYFGKDPETGEIRTWTADERAGLRAAHDAELFCINDRPDDPDGQRLIEILYAHDPVTDADCSAFRITRESDEVLAEAGGQPFTRGALNDHRHAFELIFAIRFSDEERRWFDAASIADMKNGAVGLTQAVAGFQRLAAEIKAPAKIGPHLNEQRRETIAIRIHCGNKGAEDADVARLFEVIDRHDPILYEDCERQMVVRKSDLGGLVSHVNFMASLAGFKPLTEDEIKALPKRIWPDFEAKTSGPFHYLSTFAMMSYWWSHMPVEVRHRMAATARQEAASRDDLFAYGGRLSERAGFNLAMLALCDLQKTKLYYETRRAELSSRTIINTNPNAASPWVNPEAIDDAMAFYGTMAPFVQEQCGNVWNE